MKGVPRERPQVWSEGRPETVTEMGAQGSALRGNWWGGDSPSRSVAPYIGRNKRLQGFSGHPETWEETMAAGAEEGPECHNEKDPPDHAMLMDHGVAQICETLRSMFDGGRGQLLELL